MLSNSKLVIEVILTVAVAVWQRAST